MFVNCVTLIGTGAGTVAPVYGTRRRGGYTLMTVKVASGFGEPRASGPRRGGREPHERVSGKGWRVLRPALALSSGWPSEMLPTRFESGPRLSPNRVGVASRCDSVQSNRSDITSEAEILGNRYRGAAKVCMAVRVRHGDLLGNTRDPAQLKRDRFWRGAVASYPAGPVQHDAPGRGRRARRVMYTHTRR